MLILPFTVLWKRRYIPLHGWSLFTRWRNSKAYDHGDNRRKVGAISIRNWIAHNGRCHWWREGTIVRCKIEFSLTDPGLNRMLSNPARVLKAHRFRHNMPVTLQRRLLSGVISADNAVKLRSLNRPKWYFRDWPGNKVNASCKHPGWYPCFWDVMFWNSRLRDISTKRLRKLTF